MDEPEKPFLELREFTLRRVMPRPRAHAPKRRRRHHALHVTDRIVEEPHHVPDWSNCVGHGTLDDMVAAFPNQEDEPSKANCNGAWVYQRLPVSAPRSFGRICYRDRRGNVGPAGATFVGLKCTETPRRFTHVQDRKNQT